MFPPANLIKNIDHEPSSLQKTMWVYGWSGQIAPIKWVTGQAPADYRRCAPL